MSGIRGSTATAILVACCFACSPASAFVVFKVDPTCDQPGVFSTIQGAVDAAAANAGTDYVWISHDSHTKTYTEHVVVNDPDGVIIEGGFNDCYDFDPAAELTTVSGSGNGNVPVFEIVGNGSAVYLGNLLIAYAQRADDASGGGISFTGTGELDIATTSLILNNAGYGAGINVTGTGGPNSTVLNLLHDVFISSNTAAVSGGGIRLEGGARLIVAGTDSTIKGNHAMTGYGGGIEILGPARADIGAADFNSAIGIVNDNDAPYGGGIAVIDNGNGAPVLRTFAHDATHPTTFNQNRAYINGGAIYLEGIADACLFSPHLADNIAEDGAAFYHSEYVSYDTGGPFPKTGPGSVYINGGAPQSLGSECGPETVAALGGTKSCVAKGCSTITGHQTRHADDTPSSGSAMYLSGYTVGSKLFVTHLRIQGNSAGSAIYSEGGEIVLDRCLLTDNAVSNALVMAGAYYPAGSLRVDSCTIANNTIGGDYIVDFGLDWTAELSHDIFGQPSKAAAHYGAEFQTFTVNYVVATDTAGLPVATNPGVIAGTPLFVDAAHGDYHLRVTSPGVDFAPSVAGTDLDYAPANFNLPQVVDKFGATDLGAYELQTAFACDYHADAVYCDGFGP